MASHGMKAASVKAESAAVDELSKEEKEAMLTKRMEEIRKKNQERELRQAEIEADKRRALGISSPTSQRKGRSASPPPPPTQTKPRGRGKPSQVRPKPKVGFRFNAHMDHLDDDEAFYTHQDTETLNNRVGDLSVDDEGGGETAPVYSTIPARYNQHDDRGCDAGGPWRGSGVDTRHVTGSGDHRRGPRPTDRYSERRNSDRSYEGEAWPDEGDEAHQHYSVSRGERTSSVGSEGEPWPGDSSLENDGNGSNSQYSNRSNTWTPGRQGEGSYVGRSEGFQSRNTYNQARPHHGNSSHNERGLDRNISNQQRGFDRNNTTQQKASDQTNSNRPGGLDRNNSNQHRGFSRNHNTNRQLNQNYSNQQSERGNHNKYEKGRNERNDEGVNPGEAWPDGDCLPVTSGEADARKSDVSPGEEWPDNNTNITCRTTSSKQSGERDMSNDTGVGGSDREGRWAGDRTSEIATRQSSRVFHDRRSRNGVNRNIHVNKDKEMLEARGVREDDYYEGEPWPDEAFTTPVSHAVADCHAINDDRVIADSADHEGRTDWSNRDESWREDGSLEQTVRQMRIESGRKKKGTGRDRDNRPGNSFHSDDSNGADSSEDVVEGGHKVFGEADREKHGSQGSETQPHTIEGPPPDPGYNFLSDRRREGALIPREQMIRRHPKNYGGGGDMESVKQRLKFERRQGQADNTNVPMTLSMTGHERHKYAEWKNEREKVDKLRIERQTLSSGGWKREWDLDKSEQELEESSRSEPAKRPDSAVLDEPKIQSAPMRGRGRGRSRGRGSIITSFDLPPREQTSDKSFHFDLSKNENAKTGASPVKLSPREKNYANVSPVNDFRKDFNFSSPKNGVKNTPPSPRIATNQLKVITTPPHAAMKQQRVITSRVDVNQKKVMTPPWVETNQKKVATKQEQNKVVATTPQSETNKQNATKTSPRQVCCKQDAMVIKIDNSGRKDGTVEFEYTKKKPVKRAPIGHGVKPVTSAVKPDLVKGLDRMERSEQDQPEKSVCSPPQFDVAMLRQTKKLVVDHEKVLYGEVFSLPDDTSDDAEFVLAEGVEANVGGNVEEDDEGWEDVEDDELLYEEEPEKMENTDSVQEAESAVQSQGPDDCKQKSLKLVCLPNTTTPESQVSSQSLTPLETPDFIKDLGNWADEMVSPVVKTMDKSAEFSSPNFDDSLAYDLNVAISDASQNVSTVVNNLHNDDSPPCKLIQVPADGNNIEVTSPEEEGVCTAPSNCELNVTTEDAKGINEYDEGAGGLNEREKDVGSVNENADDETVCEIRECTESINENAAEGINEKRDFGEIENELEKCLTESRDDEMNMFEVENEDSRYKTDEDAECDKKDVNEEVDNGRGVHKEVESGDNNYETAENAKFESEFETENVNEKGDNDNIMNERGDGEDCVSEIAENPRCEQKDERCIDETVESEESVN